MAKIASISRNPNGTALDFAFSDGEIVTLDIASLPEEQRVNLMFLGATNKLRDSYSSAEGSCSAARGYLAKAYDNLLQNLWNASRASSGASSKLSELAEAVAALKKLEIEPVLQTLEAMSEDQLADTRKHPQVKAKIAEIRARKAKERMKEAKEEFEFDLS